MLESWGEFIVLNKQACRPFIFLIVCSSKRLVTQNNELITPVSVVIVRGDRFSSTLLFLLLSAVMLERFIILYCYFYSVCVVAI